MAETKLKSQAISTNTDHIVLTPAASKLVKIAVLEQNSAGTNTYRNNSVILTGWGFIAGDATNITRSESVTFGITFTTAPIVIMSGLFYKDGSDPTTQGDNDAINNHFVGAEAHATSTTAFTAHVRFYNSGGYTTAAGTGTRIMYSWCAIGTL